MENSEKTLKKKVSRCYFRLPMPRPFQKKVGHKLYINTSTNENPSVASLPQEKHLSFQLEIRGHVGQVGAGFSFCARVESVTLWQGDASRKGESRFNLHKNEYPALGKSKFLSLKMYRTIAFVCMCVCVCMHAFTVLCSLALWRWVTQWSNVTFFKTRYEYTWNEYHTANRLRQKTICKQ